MTSDDALLADANLREIARLQAELADARKATLEFDRMRLLASAEVEHLAPLVRQSYALKADAIFLRAELDGTKEREAALHAKVLEWEDAYDRTAGAFDLHLAICACQNAIADYAGGYYDVLMGALAGELEELRRVLTMAMTESGSWRAAAEQLHQRNHEAFALLGKMDYFLETFRAQPDRIQRQQAAKLRAELKELVGLK